MKKLIALLTASFLSCGILMAYPITPRPLRKMVMESDYILHGKVLKLGTRVVKKGNDMWDRNYALIVVKEWLQGKPGYDTIEVAYAAGLICPAPAHFIEGEEEIIFLDGDKKNKKQFGVHALSYGVKNFLTDTGIAVYKKRIREMQHILQLDDEDQRQEATLAWLVACACNKYTAWEGIYELSPKSDFMSFYDDDPAMPKELALKQQQRQQLMDALLENDTLTYHQTGLIDMVVGLNDTKLLPFLKKQLLMIPQEDMWYATGIMQHIVKLTRNDELESLLSSINDTMFDEKKQAEQKEKYNLFIQKMKEAELKQPVYASGNSST